MTQVSVRIDEDVKESAEKTLNDIGLSMSAAITIFLNNVLAHSRYFSRELASTELMFAYS